MVDHAAKKVSAVDATAARSEADDFRCAVEQAVRAPSSHNSQPWRFRIRATGVELRADPSRRLAVVDPDGRELTISCGAALFNLRCSLRKLGYRATLELLPEPDDRELLARVHCARAPLPGSEAAEELRLARAIDGRQTHRGAFAGQTVSDELVAMLLAGAEAEGARLVRMDGAASRAALAELVAEGDRMQCSDASFRSELAGWMRPNSSPLADGLAGYTLGLGNVMSRIAPLVVRAFDVGARQTRADRKLVMDAPALAVLATDRDDARHWLVAGQALERVLLRAAADGVSASFINQSVRCPPLRERLNAMLDRPGFAQVVVILLGRAAPGRRSRRRPVSDVLQ
jgi:hypothetical protein